MRRTTLTLPAQALVQAERIARTRKVKLSAVISEALSEGLRLSTSAERGQAVLSAYKTAFGGFSDDEMAMLDGVIFDSAVAGK